MMHWVIRQWVPYIYTIGVISHHQRGVFRHSDLTQCVYICVHCSCDVSRLREYGVMKMKVQSVIVLKYSFSYQHTYVYTYLHTYLYTLICVLLWLITQANRYQNRHNKSTFGEPRQTTIIYVLNRSRPWCSECHNIRKCKCDSLVNKTGAVS